MAETQKKTNFIAQGGILALAGIISRIIGMLYRIPLMNIIGEQGSGIYSTAYDIYNIMLLISSYSLPMAVSKMVSAKLSLKQYRNVWQVLAVSMAFGAALGLAAAALMYFGAGFLAGTVLSMPRAVLAVRLLAPTVFIMGMLGVLRGFFQGHGTMVPTAVSQILEQIIHVGVSIAAAHILFNRGLEKEAAGSQMTAPAYGAAGATIGTGVGALAALLFVGFIFLLYRKTLVKRCQRDVSGVLDTPGSTLKTVVITAVPILISATMANIVNLLDHGIFGAYMGSEQMDLYETLWGAYSGKFIVLTNVPIAIATALSASTLPTVSAHMAQGDREGAMRKAASAIHVITLVALPASLALAVLGKPCLDMLFRSTDNTLAGQMLLAGFAMVIGFSLSAVSVGILQGSGLFWVPIRNYAISLAVHIPLLALALFVLKTGILGVVVCNASFGLCSSVLNIISMHRKLGYRQELKRTFGLVLAASVIMAAAAFGIYKGLYALHFGNTISMMVCIVLALIIYFAAILLLGAVNEEELRSMPKGGVLVSAAKKLRLLRREEA